MEAPEYFYYGSGEKSSTAAGCAGEHFAVDDLLDFSNEDAVAAADGFPNNAAANSADSSTVTAVDSSNSSICGDNSYYNNCNNNLSGRSFGECNFSGDLCVPYDDLAELEWLSNFVEDSFSTKQPSLSLHFLPVTGSSKPPTPDSSSTNTPTRPGPPPPPESASIFLPETPLPSKSRSRRPRAAPCDWTTRLLHLTATAAEPPQASSTMKKREGSGIATGAGPDVAPRRCLHCAAEKTPQWRTGPMGPKTLCNACGVRYKSGRLVPEYRPAASPTFVSTKHSNSHRKVLELRRQKDLQRAHHPQLHHHPQFVGQSPIFGVSSGIGGGDHEYLIGGPGFRHVM